MDIVSYQDGYLIDNRIAFAVSQPSEANYMYCAAQQGDAMQYAKHDYTVIDFPGEYDIEGIVVKCFMSKGGKLHYIINYKGKKIAIVQDTKVMNDDDFGSITDWVFSSEKIGEMIDKLEYEGEKFDLTSIGGE